MENNYSENQIANAETENPYNTYSETPAEGAKKKVHVPSMVLMIIGAAFALMFILPIVTYGCSITSLVMSIKKRRTHITVYAIVINIIALILAAANSVLGVMVQLGYFTIQ
ncbi:MAG: hypothetical protein NC253_06800 [Ruminococcus sp.]|nr:hypothetical protein [Ruminococcus sp.]MCM1382762.1 hypothetical protein [Muribaculaceae bacterium]MCM1480606.1 hypothetical protein [Muribaculaceae bacterium]